MLWNENSRKKLGFTRPSTLGPFFFIIYINGLPKNLSTHLLVYADVTTLIANHHNFNSFYTNYTACKQ